MSISYILREFAKTKKIDLFFVFLVSPFKQSFFEFVVFRIIFCDVSTDHSFLVNFILHEFHNLENTLQSPYFLTFPFSLSPRVII